MNLLRWRDRSGEANFFRQREWSNRQQFVTVSDGSQGAADSSLAGHRFGQASLSSVDLIDAAGDCFTSRLGASLAVRRPMTSNSCRMHHVEAVVLVVRMIAKNTANPTLESVSAPMIANSTPGITAKATASVGRVPFDSPLVTPPSMPPGAAKRAVAWGTNSEK